MKIGFTGTRNGITAPQELALMNFIEQVPEFEFHHGCCVGADADATLVVKDHSGATIIGHPPELQVMISAGALLINDEVKEPLPYLERNHRIVDACDVLLACPKTMEEEQRSGTWATIRYARKRGKRIVIFWPSGQVSEEGGVAT